MGGHPCRCSPDGNAGSGPLVCCRASFCSVCTTGGGVSGGFFLHIPRKQKVGAYHFGRCVPADIHCRASSKVLNHSVGPSQPLARQIPRTRLPTGPAIRKSRIFPGNPLRLKIIIVALTEAPVISAMR